MLKILSRATLKWSQQNAALRPTGDDILPTNKPFRATKLTMRLSLTRHLQTNEEVRLTNSSKSGRTPQRGGSNTE
jgi:hypothetical protein